MRKGVGGGISALVLAAGLLAALAVPCLAQDAKSLYKEGIRAFRAGNQARTIQLLTQSAEADPGYVYPALALARIYQERFEQESRNYQEAVTYYERLSALLRANPPKEAEKALYQGLYFRGLLYLKGGEYDKALDSLRTFLTVAPDFSSIDNVHNAIGIALYYQGQYDLAVAEFRSAIAIKSDFAEARFNLRSVYTRLAVYSQAVANARAGNIEAAQQQIAQLKEFAPRYLPGLRLEADLLQKTGRTDQALAVLNEIVSAEPDHPITYGVRLDMARLLEGQGDASRALQLLQENLRRFPETADQEAKKSLMLLIGRLEQTP